MDNTLVAKNLQKKYEGFQLKNVDIVVPKGEVVGFVGQNGAGKTTTIRAILNIINTDGGSVEIFGMDMKKQEGKIKEKIGVIFDDLPFENALTPIQIGKILKGMYRYWEPEAYENYLSRFGLPPKKKVGKFSRGMRMKLQIAIALSHNATFLIMDEPTSGLDPVVRSEMLDLFMEFMQDENHSVLISSHILSDLEKIADRIIFINGGEILFHEEKDMLLEQYGVIKCSKEMSESIDAKYIIRKKEYTYGVELLTNDRKAFLEKYRDIICDKPSLEDVILFYSTVKGE